MLTGDFIKALCNLRYNRGCTQRCKRFTMYKTPAFIIQQIVTMPIYGNEALNICHPYMRDILRYT